MTSIVETLNATQITQAQSQANAIANAISTSVVSSNEFVFFAAFDGTNNSTDAQANPHAPADSISITQPQAYTMLDYYYTGE